MALCTGASAKPSQARPDTRRIEKPRLTVAVNGKASLQYLPLTIAEQYGWFEAAGLELELADMASNARTLQAIGSGSADMVCGGYDQVLNQQARNQQFQSFVVLGLAPQVALGYSTLGMPGTPQLADLKGKKIGVSAPGSPSHMVASHVVSRAGLTPSDVSYVSVGSAAGAMAALRSRQIDVLCHTDPVMTTLAQRGEVVIAVDTRSRQGTLDLFGGPLPTACLHAPMDFVQRNPNTVQALVNVVVRSLKWLQTVGPSELIKVVPEAYLAGDRGLYISSFNQMRETLSPDGLMPDDGPRTALKALLRFEVGMLKPGQIELPKTFSNEFARRAPGR